MWHGFLWQWNGIYQFYQENFFLKKLRLGIHNTYNTNLQTIRRTKNINNPGHTISSFKIIWFSVIVMPRHKHEFMYWFTPNKATKYKNFQQLYSEADVSCCERRMKLEFHKKWGPMSLNQQFNEASDNHLVLWYNSSSLLTHKLKIYTRKFSSQFSKQSNSVLQLIQQMQRLIWKQKSQNKCPIIIG